MCSHSMSVVVTCDPYLLNKNMECTSVVKGNVVAGVVEDVTDKGFVVGTGINLPHKADTLLKAFVLFRNAMGRNKERMNLHVGTPVVMAVMKSPVTAADVGNVHGAARKLGRGTDLVMGLSSSILSLSKIGNIGSINDVMPGVLTEVRVMEVKETGVICKLLKTLDGTIASFGLHGCCRDPSVRGGGLVPNSVFLARVVYIHRKTKRIALSAVPSVVKWSPAAPMPSHRVGMQVTAMQVLSIEGGAWCMGAYCP